MRFGKNNFSLRGSFLADEAIHLPEILGYHAFLRRLVMTASTRIILTIYILLSTSYAASLDKNPVAQFKEYIRDIQSIAADFTQEDSSGDTARGKLLINKPFKFRCNYYPPFPLVIIGNKNYVSVYDYDMKTVSRIKAEENIFNFLLEDSIDFDKYFQIETVEDKENLLEITLYNTLSERRSKISFNKATKQIKMLTIYEDDNIITISFNRIEQVKKFDDNLFKLNNPDIFGPPSRFTKSEIEKKYE